MNPQVTVDQARTPSEEPGVMNCPKGHGPMIRGQRSWICEECGERLPLAAAQPASAPELRFTALPYPVALTAQRLFRSLETSQDALNTLFKLKDCFEATVKYLGAI